ncbi:hypothetical protein [uncultured Tenacibaculum sp.]
MYTRNNKDLIKGFEEEILKGVLTWSNSD